MVMDDDLDGIDLGILVFKIMGCSVFLIRCTNLSKVLEQEKASKDRTKWNLVDNSRYLPIAEQARLHMKISSTLTVFLMTEAGMASASLLDTTPAMTLSVWASMNFTVGQSKSHPEKVSDQSLFVRRAIRFSKKLEDAARAAMSRESSALKTRVMHSTGIE
jgi:hypothetical protein